MRCIPPRRSSRRPDVLPAGAQRRQALSCELTFGGQHGEALLVEAAAEVRAEQRAERPAVAFRVWYSAGLHVNCGQDHDQCRGDGHQESDPVRVDRQPGGVGSILERGNRRGFRRSAAAISCGPHLRTVCDGHRACWLTRRVQQRCLSRGVPVSIRTPQVCRCVSDPRRIAHSSAERVGLESIHQPG